jgi:hypothetical protein
MRRWLDPGWYRHLWSRMSLDLRLGIIFVTLAALGVGGFAAVAAIHDEPSTYFALLTTSQKTVHVREQGRIVVKRIPVVKRIYSRPVTVEQTRTIKTAGGTKIVTQPVVRYKPVYRPKVLTLRNVVTVTQPTTVTQPATVTQPVTVTGPGRTDTVTVTQTVTVPTPAITVMMTLITVTVTTP